MQVLFDTCLYFPRFQEPIFPTMASIDAFLQKAGTDYVVMKINVCFCSEKFAKSTYLMTRINLVGHGIVGERVADNWSTLIGN